MNHTPYCEVRRDIQNCSCQKKISCDHHDPQDCRQDCEPEPVKDILVKDIFDCEVCGAEHPCACEENIINLIKRG
jgi:hypothetical protein